MTYLENYLKFSNTIKRRNDPLIEYHRLCMFSDLLTWLEFSQKLWGIFEHNKDQMILWLSTIEGNQNEQARMQNLEYSFSVCQLSFLILKFLIASINRSTDKICEIKSQVTFDWLKKRKGIFSAFDLFPSVRVTDGTKWFHSMSKLFRWKEFDFTLQYWNWK